MVFLYLVVSVFASTVGAISGIGGGIIIKPLLDALGGVSVSTISFLSGTTVLSMTIVSLVKSLKLGVKIERRSSTILAVGSIAGGIAGKYLFDIVKQISHNDTAIGVIQSAFLILMTVGVLIYVLLEKRIHTLRIQAGSFIFMIGLLLGCISAFLGIGGGPLNLAVLSYFFSMDSKTAAANSIYIIFFSQTASLLFTAVSGTIPAFSAIVLIAMILGGILGGFWGSIARVRMSSQNVSRLFCGVMGIIIVIVCSNLYKYCSML